MGIETTATIDAARPAAAVEVVPTGAAVGAEVRAVDLRQMDEVLFSAIHAAWLAHSVLLFRGQSLSDDDLVVDARRMSPA